jgi:hypothetical protein
MLILFFIFSAGKLIFIIHRTIINDFIEETKNKSEQTPKPFLMDWNLNYFSIMEPDWGNVECREN